jgi:nuclear pore complex protein Nup133
VLYIKSAGPTHSVLNDVVYAFMCEIHEGHHEDFMRAFFKLRVEDIGILVEKVLEVTLNTARNTGRPVATLLPEANRIALVCRSMNDPMRHVC